MFKKSSDRELCSNIKIEVEARKILNSKVIFVFLLNFFSISYFFSHFSHPYFIFKCWIGNSKEYDTVKDFDRSTDLEFLIGVYFGFWNQFYSINLFEHGRGQKRLDKVRLHLIWHSTIHTPQNQQRIELEASWLWILEEACCFVSQFYLKIFFHSAE